MPFRASTMQYTIIMSRTPTKKLRSNFNSTAAEETKEDLEKAVDELNKESDAGEACEATEATCSEAETTNT